MDTNTYTEEEFKKVLKNLFAEKKRVKDLQKQLQKKFQTKLAGYHKLPIIEEYAALKSVFAAKENECLDLKSKLERVRPALKKLVDDLKGARAEIETLKNQNENSRDGELKARLAQVLEHVAVLEREKECLVYEKKRLEKDKERLEEEKTRLLEEEGESRLSREQLLELEEELRAQKQMCISLGEEKQRVETSFYEIKKTFEEKERGLEQMVHRFEAERSRLVERLADGLSQLQRQADIIKDLKDENRAFHHELESGREKIKSYERQLFELKEKQRALLGELAEAQAQLEGSDLVSIREEYEAKIAERDRLKNENAALAEELQNTVEQKEKALEKSYAKMRELSSRHAEIAAEFESASKKIEEGKHQVVHLEKEREERHADIRKAHQHLAKKVKEATILRDMAERQKGEIAELKSTLTNRESELERLQNSLDIHKMHEQKIQSMANERTQAAEVLAKEWQEKYLCLQQDWQEKKVQVLELQKMRENYDQMAATVSSLKNILGKGIIVDETP